MPEHATKQVVVEALESLLREDGLRAISLSGEWGVGKTRLFNDFAQTHAAALRESGRKFVYVSVFGLAALDAVRSRIAANSLSVAQRVMARIPLIAQVGLVDMAKVGEIARSIAEDELLKNLFVVIDDLERADPDLAPQGVVGLISELVEQYGCKCVLVLNKVELAKRITAFEEKVFDLTLNYQPEIAEILPYGLPREDDCRLALPVFEGFRCANIRIAKRLSWILRALGETTFKEAAKIWPTIVRQATVLAIVKYKYGFDRAQLEMVIARTETAKFMRDLNREIGESKPDELPAEVTTILDRIEHQDAGFGTSIVDLLEQGTLDHPTLAKALEARAQMELHLSQVERLHGFFGEMKAGFQLSGSALSQKITAFLKEKLVFPDRFDLLNLCDLLIQIDSSEYAIALAAQTLHRPISPASAASREKHLKEFRHLWAAGVFDRIPYVPSVRKFSHAECFDVNTWEPHEMADKAAALAKFSVDEWIDFLVSLRADDAMLRIRSLRAQLKQEEVFPPESLLTVRTNVDAALKAIGDRDPLFRAKIADYANPDRKVGPF